MKNFFNKLTMNSKNMQRYRNRRRITCRILSVILAIMLISTPIILLFGALSNKYSAQADDMCIHEHTNECYTAPEGHICTVILDENGESTGCTPIYHKTTVVISEGNTHSGTCYGTINRHTHDDTCYSDTSEDAEEDAEEDVLICDEPENDTEQLLLCNIEESADETETVYDTDADPIGMICRARTVLVCEHSECVFNEVCKLEAGTETPSGEETGGNPDILTPDGDQDVQNPDDLNAPDGDQPGRKAA